MRSEFAGGVLAAILLLSARHRCWQATPRQLWSPRQRQADLARWVRTSCAAGPGRSGQPCLGKGRVPRPRMKRNGRRQRSTTRSRPGWRCALGRSPAPKFVSAPTRSTLPKAPRSRSSNSTSRWPRSRSGKAGSISTSARLTPAKLCRSTSRSAGSGCSSQAATTSTPAAATRWCVIAAFTGAARFVGRGGDIPIAAGDRVVVRRRRAAKAAAPSRLPATNSPNGAAAARLTMPGWPHRISFRAR